MLKKICLGVVFIASVAMAEIPVIKPEFESLLRKNGVVAKNTLRIEHITNEEGYGSIEAKGDLIATGVLVSTPNDTYFYPDRNLKNLFYDRDQITKCASPLQSCKPSENTPVQVYGDDVVAKAFGAVIYGSQAARVKIHITNFKYIENAYRGQTSWQVRAKEILRLTAPKKIYESYAPYFPITRDIAYISKDDYIHIRNAPQGEIIGRIAKADMQESRMRKSDVQESDMPDELDEPEEPKGGILIGANCRKAEDYGEDEAIEEPIECVEANGWYEVFYFPPGVRKGKDALHGYIHTSQVKLKPSDISRYMECDEW